MLKKVHEFTEEDKRKFIEMTGKIMLGVAERRSIWDMAKDCNLEPWQVVYNIDEMLYGLRKYVGFKRFFKALFIK